MKVKSNRIGDVILFYHDFLKKKYTKEEINELIFLAFEDVLSLSREKLRIGENDYLNQSDLILIYDIAKELEKGKPIQYILNKAWFYNCFYYVDERVLIPRPETEELVDLILKENSQERINILDIGTGSGCIPISLKKNRSHWNVHALDVSEKALEVAEINLKLLNCTVGLKHFDILSGTPNYEEKFDIIVSNPPYIAKKEIDSMQDQVIDFEPHLALFVSDSEPFLFYKKISKQANALLCKGGKLYFEINQLYGNEIFEIMKQNGFDNIKIIKDINQNDRIVCGVLTANRQ